MTIQDFLAKATEKLKIAGIESARLDCLILLEDALDLDRATILAYPETAIPAPQLTILNKHITQRAKHVPLAYIRGHAPFFGRDFFVNKHVLVPRPETETMIEMLQTLPLPAKPSICDIGTGSGCIGITAALELQNAQVGLYDIDLQALEAAKHNATQLEATVKIHQADLLSLKPTADVILANLPYVPEAYKINRAAKHEPQLAIFAGKDGLDLYRRFWSQVAALHHKPVLILTESLPQQHKELSALAKDSGYALHNSRDLIQTFKQID
jgi:release factor glutamine methyltransferase